ncbi:MAG: adenylosuccinate lyase, partial [Clostridia bacterium]|nr:adenylosuccinate lyase [Clostridia bacterium]
LALLGSKGATGTQASFVDLFAGDSEKIKGIEKYVEQKFGFTKTVPVSGQTYSRKFDTRVLSVLSGIAQSAYKFSNDMRILSSFKEMEEPFEKNQIGSSAMPYKRNPMRSERISSLARYVITDVQNAAFTNATQWFERTLDDSANKRLSVAEGFLAVDAILNIYINVTNGIVVYPKVIESRIMRELPFMASENIMMDAVKKGGDRQDLHERIRVHSVAAGKVVKEEGGDNDLLERISTDEAFGMTLEELKAHLDPSNYVGRAPEQTAEFIENHIDPVLEANADMLSDGNELNV